MNTILLTVTGLAVLVAMAASFVAWQAVSIERRRRDARVAVLAAAADVAVIDANAPGAAAEPAPGLQEFLPARDTTAAAVATPVGALLGTAVADSGSGGRQHRLLAAAALAFVAVAGGALAPAVIGRAPGAAIAAVGVPLELVSLAHARPAGQFTISGLVQNPATGTSIDALEAQVRVFDATGILIATRSAPVGVATLPPGVEVPFTVAFGDAATAARYRVSFASRGAMLAHVDRRTNLPAGVTAEAR